jgi:hypothetical protein
MKLLVDSRAVSIKGGLLSIFNPQISLPYHKVGNHPKKFDNVLRSEKKRMVFLTQPNDRPTGLSVAGGAGIAQT